MQAILLVCDKSGSETTTLGSASFALGSDEALWASPEASSDVCLVGPEVAFGHE
jgi:hypothetical protein